MVYNQPFCANTEICKGGYAMKSNDDSKRWTRFLHRNGVYIALAISIVAVGSVLIAGLTQKLTKSNQNGSLNAQQQVEQKVTGQKDTRTNRTSVSATQTVTKKTARLGL
jgi:hypothetical protein